MALDRADVEHIAILARIGITKEEVETFREQLSDILDSLKPSKTLTPRASPPPVMRANSRPFCERTLPRILWSRNRFSVTLRGEKGRFSVSKRFWRNRAFGRI